MDLFSSGAPTWNRSGEALLQLSIKNIRAELSNSETTFATGYRDAWWSLNHREICVGKPARKKLDDVVKSVYALKYETGASRLPRRPAMRMHRRAAPEP